LKPPKSANLPATSLIIQHVTASFNVRNAKTNEKIVIPDWNYWEAWEVPPGATSPPTLPGKSVDDIFWNKNKYVNTCGTIIISGSALFYPYTTLPADFKPGGAPQSGILYSTINGGSMAGLQARSFPPVTHTVIATWTTKNRGHTYVNNTISRPAPEPWPGTIA
jgi:hypothetical protein